MDSGDNTEAIQQLQLATDRMGTFTTISEQTIDSQGNSDVQGNSDSQSNSDSESDDNGEESEEGSGEDSDEPGDTDENDEGGLEPRASIPTFFCLIGNKCKIVVFFVPIFLSSVIEFI